ncbi:hypothetical protein Zm00014a_003791 [Zea mays]|jgi:hypothetical protein|uniref:Senescence regulator n=1 Tax=Zea mays TaxID=4577 RepID=A0A3L6FPT0_MAIZE|nr:hypothetical protein Zm00014a_003791 [Zea mays]
MAGSARSAAAKHAYRMFVAPSRGGAAARGPGAGAAEEFDESDVWGSFGADSQYSSPGAELGAGWARPIPGSGARRKKPVDGGGGAAGSLPMNIPDWQKILGVEYRDHHRAGEWEPGADDDDDDDGSSYGRARGGAEMVPPHELAWRSRAASLSVHEGIGRTLKGRDLSRVRDAVWKKTGFED